MTSPRHVRPWIFAAAISCLCQVPVLGYDHSTGSPVITRSITVPESAPSSAVEVPLDFVGFGFGQAWLPNYANTFSENLIRSVATRMADGVAPIIRLGGTVGDKFLWNPNQTQAVVPVDGEDPTSSGSTFILGPAFFDGLKLFPDAKMTFQATLGKTLNFSSTIPIIENAYAALGPDRLAAIAIGNEVSVEYGTAQGYVAAAREVESRIIEALNLTGDARVIFEVVDTLSPVGSTHNPWAAYVQSERVSIWVIRLTHLMPARRRGKWG